jgi:hypothetical protein
MLQVFLYMSGLLHKYIVGIIVKGKGAGIKGEYDPGILGMKVNGFNSGRSLKHELFDLETEGHF